MSGGRWTDAPLAGRWLGARRVENVTLAGDWLGTYVETTVDWRTLDWVVARGTGEITAGDAGPTAGSRELEPPAPGVAAGVVLFESC